MPADHEHQPSITLQGEGSYFEICKCGYFLSAYGSIAAKPSVWHSDDEVSEMLSLLAQQWISRDELNAYNGQAFLLGIAEGKKQSAEFLLKLSMEFFSTGHDDVAKLLRQFSGTLKAESESNSKTAQAVIPAPEK